LGKDRFSLIEFYTDGLRGVDSLLELGSSAGILTIPLAKLGYMVDTLDFTIDMHDVIREKLSHYCSGVARNIQFILADVRTYVPKKKYDAVIMPENFLLAHDTYDIQKSILRMCYTALETGGVLMFDVFYPVTDAIVGDKISDTTRFRAKNDTYILNVIHSIDVNVQHHTCKLNYKKRADKNSFTSVANVDITYRYLYKEQIIRALREIGFTKICMFDIFEGKSMFFLVRK